MLDGSPRVAQLHRAKSDLDACPRVRSLAAGSTVVQRALGFNVVIQETLIISTPGVEKRRTKRIREVYPGMTFVVVAEENGFSQVRKQGHTVGWIKSERLRPQPKPESENVEDSMFESRGPLYGPSRQPELADVRQGNLDDCYLIAVIGAIANSPVGKRLIQANILPKPNDTGFYVKLFDIDETNELSGTQAFVDRWFPGIDDTIEDTDWGSDGDPDPYQHAYCPYAKVLPNELGPPIWAAILEKAYAATEDGGYGGITNANTSRAIGHLTGVVPDAISWDTAGVPGTPDWAPAFSREVDEDNGLAVPDIPANELVQVLIEAKARRGGMLLAEANDIDGWVDRRLGIHGNHVFVVRAVTPRRVDLWDPNIPDVHPSVTPGQFRAFFERILFADLGAAFRPRMGREMRSHPPPRLPPAPESPQSVSPLALAVFDGPSSSDMSRSDAFSLLGVPMNADVSRVTLAYRTLSRVMHPDRTGGRTTEQFQQLLRAYTVAQETPEETEQREKEAQSTKPLAITYE